VELQVEPKHIGAQERRGKMRFPIRLKVSYKLTRSGAQGSVMTMNIGSKGVLLAGVRFGPEALHLPIELRIEWPLALEDGTLLQLLAQGKILRVNEWTCAVQFLHTQFVTRARLAKAVGI
jgi:hypothetical protein